MNLLCYPSQYRVVVYSYFSSILTPNHILRPAQERHHYAQLFQDEPWDMPETTPNKTYRSHLTRHPLLFLPVYKDG